MTKKAIALIRVSTEGQAADDRAGIPAQREAIRKTAERYGLEIVKTIEMVDVSGARILAAPEIADLFRLMEDPGIHGVVAKEFSRLMRPDNPADFVILQHFVETKTMLFLPDGPIDFSNKSGRLFGGIRALMAGFERSEIIERMNDAKEAMRRQGKNTGGTATLPYGVSCTDGAWGYAAEAEKVRRAFHLVLNTSRPYAQIAAELNIGRTNLRFILGNPIYTGMRVYNQKRDPRAAAYVPGPDGRQGYRKKMRRAPDEVIRVRVMEPLVSQEMFDKVQKILSSRAAVRYEAIIRGKSQYLFNGFLTCAECESPMYQHNAKLRPRIDGSKRDGRFYVCKQNGTRARKANPESHCPTPHIMAAKIEPKIESLFSERLQDENFLGEIAASYLAAQPQEIVAAPNNHAMSRQVETLRTKRSRILDSYYDGVIDKRERDERLAKIDAEIESYGRVQVVAIPEPRRMDVAALAETLSVFAEMAFLAREQKRSLMHSLGVEIYVSGYTIRELAMRNFAAPTQGIAERHTDRHSKTAACRSRALRCHSLFLRASCWRRP